MPVITPFQSSWRSYVVSTDISANFLIVIPIIVQRIPPAMFAYTFPSICHRCLNESHALL